MGVDFNSLRTLPFVWAALVASWAEFHEPYIHVMGLLLCQKFPQQAQFFTGHKLLELALYVMNLILGLEWADGIFLFWVLLDLGLMKDFGLDCVSFGLKLSIGF